ncbi:urease accessory protein UreD [Planomonospora parontospora]|uniref:urease accessory protein UreD n=1 Tax=Planomonospora parontospora TaxID=58119 RepID=UPI00194557D2|nr:urease accessory protein UreD [Planomonospora parontospora]GGL15807.1 urease accessory protein UreD [Planomonospora parontospora subsp. antibiotica]GII16014.1 urease accessory protein UreD [Planomonospora parontospora subsp. antibiotica]
MTTTARAHRPAAPPGEDAAACSLHATARITATAADGTTDLPLLQGDGPFDLRRLPSRGGPARVCVLGAMSAPHNGDRLRIEITVEAGADLHLTSAAATVALPGPAPGHAVYDVLLRVGRDARLHWLPEPVISAAGSDLRQHIRVDLAPTARLLLSEQQILGRAREPTGRLDSRLTVRRGGRTLLDQQTSFGPGAPGWDGPAVLDGNRAVGQLLLLGPGLTGGSGPVEILGGTPADGHGVIVPLDGPGRLATAVAPDAGDLRRLLDTARHRFGIEDDAGPPRPRGR